jgi:hypothetical protein
MGRLMNDYKFSIADDGFNFLRSKFDSTKNVTDYNLDSLFQQDDKNKVLAKFDGGDIKINDLINLLNVNRDYTRSLLTNETIRTIINASAESPILNKKAMDENVEKDDEYVNNLKDYENGLLIFRVDQDELWSKVKINDSDIESYYASNKTKYTKADSTGQQVGKSLDEVKGEISNELQQAKFKEIEKAYLDGLRQKYPVKIYEDVLKESFSD